MSASVAGRVIRDLYDRGLTRKEIAEQLSINAANITHAITDEKNGYLSDDKMRHLANLHGKYTPEELILQKHLERVIRETGMDTNVIIKTLQRLRRRKAILLP